MRFTHDGGQYRLRFRHFHGATGAVYTTAYLERLVAHGEGGEVVGWDEVARGDARCSPLDNFRKETGRVLALRRLTLALDKALHPVVWRVYLTRKQQKGVLVA